jgi:hypothetical protein
MRQTLPARAYSGKLSVSLSFLHSNGPRLLLPTPRCLSSLGASSSSQLPPSSFPSRLATSFRLSRAAPLRERCSLPHAWQAADEGTPARGGSMLRLRHLLEEAATAASISVCGGDDIQGARRAAAEVARPRIQSVVSPPPPPPRHLPEPLSPAADPRSRWIRRRLFLPRRLPPPPPSASSSTAPEAARARRRCKASRSRPP